MQEPLDRALERGPRDARKPTPGGLERPPPGNEPLGPEARVLEPGPREHERGLELVGPRLDGQQARRLGQGEAEREAPAGQDPIELLRRMAAEAAGEERVAGQEIEAGAVGR